MIFLCKRLYQQVKFWQNNFNTIYSAKKQSLGICVIWQTVTCASSPSETKPITDLKYRRYGIIQEKWVWSLDLSQHSNHMVYK